VFERACGVGLKVKLDPKPGSHKECAREYACVQHWAKRVVMSMLQLAVCLHTQHGKGGRQGMLDPSGLLHLAGSTATDCLAQLREISHQLDSLADTTKHMLRHMTHLLLWCRPALS
jgi:hypothetical protein